MKWASRVWAQVFADFLAGFNEIDRDGGEIARFV